MLIQLFAHLNNRLVRIFSPSDTNEQSFAFQFGNVRFVVDLNDLKNACLNEEIYPRGSERAARARDLWEHLTATCATNENFALIKKYDSNVLGEWLEDFAENEQGQNGTVLNDNWNGLCVVTQTLHELSRILRVMDNTMDGNVREILDQAADFFQHMVIPTANRQDSQLVIELVKTLRFIIATYDDYIVHNPLIDFRPVDATLIYQYGSAEKLKCNNSRNLPCAMDIIEALTNEDGLEITGNSFYTNQHFVINPRPDILNIAYIAQVQVFVPNGGQNNLALRARLPGHLFNDLNVINGVVDFNINVQ